STARGPQESDPPIPPPRPSGAAQEAAGGPPALWSAIPEPSVLSCGLPTVAPSAQPLQVLLAVVPAARLRYNVVNVFTGPPAAPGRVVAPLERAGADRITGEDHEPEPAPAPAVTTP